MRFEDRKDSLRKSISSGFGCVRARADKCGSVSGLAPMFVESIDCGRPTRERFPPNPCGTATRFCYRGRNSEGAQAGIILSTLTLGNCAGRASRTKKIHVGVNPGRILTRANMLRTCASMPPARRPRWSSLSAAGDRHLNFACRVRICGASAGSAMNTPALWNCARSVAETEHIHSGSLFWVDLDAREHDADECGNVFGSSPSLVGSINSR